MLSVRRSFLLASSLALALTAPLAFGGTETVTFDSPALGNNTLGMPSTIDVRIYTPPGYDGSTGRYPTVYYLAGYTAGFYGFPGDAEFETAIDEGDIPPVIGIGVPNRTTKMGTMFLNSTAFGMWEEFLIDELMAYVDANYRTIPDPRRRALTGASAGGYSAVVLPLRHPGLWGGVGTNDAAMQLGCSVPNIPEDSMEDAATTGDLFKMIDLQMGEAIARNPDAPLGFDLPYDREAGEWVPEVRDLWNSYCFQNPASMERFQDDILAVHRYAITVGGISANATMVRLMEEMGADVVGFPIVGGHGDFAVERFLEVTEDIFGVLMDVPMGTAVGAQGKASMLWADIKAR